MILSASVAEFQLQPVDPATHRLARLRPAPIALTLETRSYLVHDLAHYAVEAEAGIERGFWGLMAEGADPASLRAFVGEEQTDLDRAEALAGPFQALWHGRLDAAGYAERLGSRIPDAEVLVRRAHARMRALMGAWKATTPRSAMTLTWPPAAPSVSGVRGS